MNSKIKVAFLGGRGITSNYGGVENATRAIATNLINYDDITPLVYGVKQSHSQKHNCLDGLVSIDAPLFIYNLMGQHGMILWCVLHIVFISRPKVVVVFASGPCIFVPFLRMFGIKVISSLRAIDSKRGKWSFFNEKVLELGEFFAWKFSNEFTVNSLAMQKYYSAWRKAHFIPNGSEIINNEKNTFDLSSQLPLKKNQFFFFAARLDPVKRLHLLLEAHSELPENCSIPLVIAGGNCKDKNYENYLKSFACNNVFFLGHVSPTVVDSYMINCKAFVLPSILEGMSNSILSAMINGKPVIAANVPENLDLLEVDDAVFEADSKDLLKEKLIAIATNDDFCLSLGKKLKTIAKNNYSWEKTSLNFYNLIKEINIS
tara:strand:- start:6299 stop:7420 length:1122 start_codon:yes stop_codon:yes gene_type:complete